AADCIYRSGIKGEMENVSGDLTSIMAGLACGEPNPVTWPILRDCSHSFISAKDEVAALGMRILGNPLAGDSVVTSGESGALSMGILHQLMTTEDGRQQAEKMGLNRDSVIMIFSTEGDTNPERYRRIVWTGSAC
ncbi:diaminopropionate ammonia-lyase, partial [Photobacterium damselae subsp. damselae]